MEELIEKILKSLGFNKALKSLGHKHYIQSRRKSVVDMAGMLVDTAEGEPSPRSMAAAISSDSDLYKTREIQDAQEESKQRQEKKQEEERKPRLALTKIKRVHVTVGF